MRVGYIALIVAHFIIGTPTVLSFSSCFRPPNGGTNPHLSFMKGPGSYTNEIKRSLVLSASTAASGLSNNTIRDSSPSSALDFAEIARGGQAELLLSKTSLDFYFMENTTEDDELMALAKACRKAYLTCGIAHVPNFLRPEMVQEMVQEATKLYQNKECFYSTEDHTVYQEPHDDNFPPDHPRNALQRSSKWIIDFARLAKDPASSQFSLSPLYVLYKSPALRSFVSYVVRPFTTSSDNIDNYAGWELYESGCDYNAAYYNIYTPGDGLGFHFDRSRFGVNLELQPAQEGGTFELCWNTRTTPTEWAFEKVQEILDESSATYCPSAHRVRDPSPVGPGSLVLFAGSRNLHRVTTIGYTSNSRINAIMTYEREPNQKPNAYSLQKFFGR